MRLNLALSGRLPCDGLAVLGLLGLDLGFERLGLRLGLRLGGLLGLRLGGLL